MNAKREPDLRLVDEALELAGQTVVGEPEERVARLKDHYEKLPDDQLSDCSECGFGSPIDHAACDFCGHTGGAEVILSPGGLGLSSEEAERKLDQAIARYAAAGRDMIGSGWDMGNAAREIRESKLYLARRGPRGEPLYRNFEEFCRRELNRSSMDVRRMIDVSSNFTRQEAVEVGTTKLGITLRIADPERRAPLLEMARDPDVTVRQLSEATSEVAKAQAPRADRLGRPHGGGRKRVPIFPPVAPFMARPAPQAEPASVDKAKRPRRLSISVEEGEHQVLLYAQRTSPTDQRRAREIADKPAGRIRFLNGTQMRVILLRSEKGLFAKLEFTEAPEEDLEG